MARWQAVHRRRRQMRLGHAARQIAGQAAAQPAQGLVPQPGRHRAGRRSRSDICAEAVAAGLSHAVGERHVASLSVPRQFARHAHPPDRHWPFKFAEFKPNEYIRVVKNPDYWKPGRPYLDGVEWTIIPNRSTQTLAFIAGKFDMSFPYEVTLQSMRDIHNQAPNAICEMTPTPLAMNLLVNRDAAPFNEPDIRRAMQLTIDRKSFLDIIAEGQADINGAMHSPPARLAGPPPQALVTLPGYGPDVTANRAEARK